MDLFGKKTAEVILPADFRIASGVEIYLSRKFDSLENDYRTLDGKSAESCVLIARDISFLLLEMGLRPEIFSIRGQEESIPGILSNEGLIPRRYEGRIEWGGHSVCVCDNFVYDPLVRPAPIPQGEYLPLAFTNQNPIFSPTLNTQYIRERFEEEKVHNNSTKTD